MRAPQNTFQDIWKALWSLHVLLVSAHNWSVESTSWRPSRHRKSVPILVFSNISGTAMKQREYFKTHPKASGKLSRGYNFCDFQCGTEALRAPGPVFSTFPAPEWSNENTFKCFPRDRKSSLGLTLSTSSSMELTRSEHRMTLFESSENHSRTCIFPNFPHRNNNEHSFETLPKTSVKHCRAYIFHEFQHGTEASRAPRDALRLIGKAFQDLHFSTFPTLK